MKKKKKNQKLNKYFIHIQSIRIDFTLSCRLRPNNSLSWPCPSPFLPIYLKKGGKENSREDSGARFLKQLKVVTAAHCNLK